MLNGNVKSIDEVQQVNARFRQLAHILDLILHYMYMDYEDIQHYRGNFRNDVKKNLRIFLWLWNYLRLSMIGAKFHLVKDHFINQLDLWGAIGPFNEEFGESDHVDGNREFRKFGCMKSAARRETAISRNHQMKSNPKIKAVKESLNSNDKKRVRVTKTKGELIKANRKQAIDEVEFMMGVHGNDNVQIEDYWNKTSSIS